MKPIRTAQDKENLLTSIARLKALAQEKGYRFGTAYDDAAERLEALKKQKDEAIK